MKLYHAGPSPYARKVRVAALELGVQLELVATSALAADSDYGRINPMHRIPALELEDGGVLFDSPVIVEYLDVTHGPRLIPPSGKERWAVLRLQALGDGLMDAAVPLRHENARPAEQRSPEQIGRYRRSMRQTMDYLEAHVGQLAGVSAGTIAIACALAYVSFRHPDEDWQALRPRLAAWSRAFAERPAMQATSFDG